MKRVTLILPLLATAVVAAYYHHNESAADSHRPQPGVAVPVAASPIADRDGARDARTDLAAGQLVFLTHGRVTSVIAAYQAELRNSHGIELRFVTAEDELDPTTRRYTIAYNAVMLSAIRAAHGEDVFDQSRDRAWTAWRASQ